MPGSDGLSPALARASRGRRRRRGRAADPSPSTQASDTRPLRGPIRRRRSRRPIVRPCPIRRSSPPSRPGRPFSGGYRRDADESGPGARADEGSETRAAETATAASSPLTYSWAREILPISSAISDPPRRGWPIAPPFESCGPPSSSEFGDRSPASVAAEEDRFVLLGLGNVEPPEERRRGRCRVRCRMAARRLNRAAPRDGVLRAFRIFGSSTGRWRASHLPYVSAVATGASISPSKSFRNRA